MKCILVILVILSCAFLINSQKIYHQCVACSESTSCTNNCWKVSGAGFDNTQVCAVTQCKVGQLQDIYAQSCNANIHQTNCSSKCCYGFSALSTQAFCAETRFNNDNTLAAKYCQGQLNNGIVAAITVSAVLAAICGSAIVICSVRLCCPQKQARGDKASRSENSTLYSLNSQKSKEPIQKTSSSNSHKKKKLKRISDEIRDAQKMSQFQDKIGSVVLAPNSNAPIKKQKDFIKQSQTENAQSNIHSNPSTGPIVVKGDSKIISLGSGDSQIPLNQNNAYKKRVKNLDQDQC